MTMQRRHFELIAETIRDFALPGDNESSWRRALVARHFAHRLRATNPNFNEARFLRACGVE